MKVAIVRDSKGTVVATYEITTDGSSRIEVMQEGESQILEVEEIDVSPSYLANIDALYEKYQESQ